MMYNCKRKRIEINDVTQQIRDKNQHTCKSDAFENGLSRNMSGISVYLFA